MDDFALLEDALRKGGADAIVSKLPKGIDQELNKDWTPPAEGTMDDKSKAPEAAAEGSAKAVGAATTSSTGSDPVAGVDVKKARVTAPSIPSSLGLKVGGGGRRGTGMGQRRALLRQQRIACEGT